MQGWSKVALAVVGSAMAVHVAAQVPQPRPARGALLYDTHCVACHNSQIHWRDDKRASDWPKLVAEVQRWQARLLLGWSAEDVMAVARHLNERIYRYPEGEARVGQASH